MAKDARDYVWLECTECGERNYRTQKRMKGVQTKLQLKKYCSRERKHTVHVEKKK
ncbi:MAG: 50S ribosomal protein L33 [Planctomycetota bacterium]